MTEKPNLPKSKVSIADGTIKVVPQRKKVAIVGGGYERLNAPYYDGTWECWGLNEIPQPRAERWFEIHPWEVQSPYEKEWLRKCKKPVYLIDLHPEIPMGVRYPLGEVLNLSGARNYFSCTYAYQIALAILDGFEEIGLWGTDLPSGSPREQTVERACVEWWLGLAEGKGVKIYIDPQSSLRSHLFNYGYDYYEEKRSVDVRMHALATRFAYDGLNRRKKSIWDINPPD